MTVLLAKAIAMALLQHPMVNLQLQGWKELHINSSINIAIAVAIDGGLITSALQDAGMVKHFTVHNECWFFMIFFKWVVTCWFMRLDIYSLSRKWKELVDKARAKQLQPHEYNPDISLPHTQIWIFSTLLYIFSNALNKMWWYSAE
jgi:pyruvate dehydrogenase E2 component (dihydrolipoamide acetyltransferase)